MNHCFLLFLILPATVGQWPFPQDLSVEAVVERTSPAVVKIVVYDITGAKKGEGSGFFVGHGKILTNAHVIEDAYSAEVYGFTSSYEHVTIAKRNDDVDLALLAVEDLEELILTFADGRDLRPGQRVVAIGNPLGLERTVSDGLISAVRGISGEIQIIQISAPISPGSSGGPLLNMRGLVIGVTSASASEGQNLNFAIGVETLKKFLTQPDNPVVLNKARTRVLWRAILKWLVNIVLLVIALLFGGGWWIIVIAIMILAGVFYIFRGLWKLITLPFRRKTAIHAPVGSEERYRVLSQDENTKQSFVFPEEEQHKEDDEEDEEDKVFTFYCWKCGELVEVDRSLEAERVQCPRCDETLKVPEG